MWPEGKRNQSFTNLIISRFWWFLWIWKMEMDVYSSTFLPKNSRTSQKQAEPPNANSCWRPARLRPCPHIHTLGKAQFFLSLATKQEKPTCSSLFLSDTYSKGQQHCWIIIKKKTCYHLPRTASQEGPSAPFLCECLKERKRENNKTHEGFYQAQRFYFHWKRSFWFDFYELNRSAKEKRTRPLFPPLLKHLQREFYGKHARHRKMQQIKSWDTKRSDLPFSPFGLIKAKRAAFYMFILFSGFLSRRSREQSINGKATLWEKWKSCFGGRWPVVLSCSVCLCPLKAKATKATWRPLLSSFLKDSPVFFSLSSPIWNTHTHAGKQDGHTLTMLSLLKKQPCLWKHTAAVNEDRFCWKCSAEVTDKKISAWTI